MKEKVTRSLDPYMNRLQPHMEALERGDWLYDDDVIRLSGMPVKTLDTRIRKWFRGRGIKIVHRPSPRPGFRLLTHVEQAMEVPKNMRLAMKRHAAAHLWGMSIDPLQLPTDKHRESHEFHMDKNYTLLRAAAGAVAESQFMLTGKKPSIKLPDSTT